MSDQRMRLTPGIITLLVMGTLSGVPALLSLLGAGGVMHPLLADRMAGLGLLTIALSCFGAAFFPFVAERLTRREQLDTLTRQRQQQQTPPSATRIVPPPVDRE